MNAKRVGVGLLLGLASVSVSSLAWGHARLLGGSALPPRTSADNLKTGPCGGVPAGTPTTFPPGATLDVQWEETIDHPGWYEFRFSSDGTDFSQLLLRLDDTQNGYGDLPHRYTARLTLPDAPCERCVVQFIQVMTDRSPPTNYYSCADISLVTGAPMPTIAASPVPDRTPLPASTDSPPAKARAVAPTNLRLKWRQEAP